ncbi:hypothetical protein [Amycolatopsis cihanbeyliensis]|uniref:Uncharacterized protein n=1 Tax=Amycolatopsis cihanbeyliensis TaxID=1128664 RepID=A0A542DDE7_AMYCI|nr:hypothetical protein [Amycolatopsis cihanbeyliensis]TQJ01097.1 hypothetical protein FB471_0762 [Amycolatopsis cihanbeyliensis]
MNATEQALAAYPELRRLMELRDAGWMFLPHTDPDGELVEVRGVRAWPGTGSADALLVRYVTDAAALRSSADGVVWQREGGLVEVVDGLLTLPAPGTPGAPRLVRGSAPGKLWLPRDA